jgi:hypothetical protein
MRAVLTINNDNFADKERVPRSFGADIEGSKVLTIKTKWNGENKCFQFDLKNVCFGDESLLIEGIIGDDKSVIGRCVFSLTRFDIPDKGTHEPPPHTPNS